MLHERILDEAHAGQLPALIEEWLAASGARYWIARALRIDLPLLVTEPALAMPCLYRRLAVVDSNDVFYGARSLATWSTDRELAAMFSAWPPSEPWLRALRPPTVPVDGAVIEEYRSDLAGALAFGTDCIGVIGETQTVAWDRDTGRRRDDALLAREPTYETAWQRSQSSTWGVLEIECGALTRKFTIDRYETVHRLRPLGNGWLLATADDSEGGERTLVIDPERGRIVWELAGAVGAFVVRDDLLYTSGQHVRVLALSTGRVVASWGVPYTDGLAVARDGTVATRHGAVIRVWDRALAADPQVKLRVSNTWLAPTFSPDGRLVVTGDLLASADGARVRRVPANTPGWLEGGPPPNCQALVNGAFVEAQPFGFHAWTLDGELAADRERGARHGDVVAFDPTGRTHAIWSRTGRFTVSTLRGDIVYESMLTPTPHDRYIEYTADGNALLVRGHSHVRIDLVARSLAPIPADAVQWTTAPTPTIVVDGILDLGGARLPCDDPKVATRDRYAAWFHTHVVRED